jgi:phage terminase large subunit-like protein
MVPKVVRIRRLTPLLSQGRLRFKAGSKGAKLLVEQLRDFPCGEHDDGPDALEVAWRLSCELLSRRFEEDALGEVEYIPIEYRTW